MWALGWLNRGRESPERAESGEGLRGKEEAPDRLGVQERPKGRERLVHHHHQLLLLLIKHPLCTSIVQSFGQALLHLIDGITLQMRTLRPGRGSQSLRVMQLAQGLLARMQVQDASGP